MISPALEYAELRRSYKFREPKAKVGRVCEKDWETFRRHKQQQAPSVGGQPIRLGHFEEGAPSLVRSEGIPVKEKCDISSPRYVRGNSAGFFFFFFFSLSLRLSGHVPSLQAIYRDWPTATDSFVSICKPVTAYLSIRPSMALCACSIQLRSFKFAGHEFMACFF